MNGGRHAQRPGGSYRQGLVDQRILESVRRKAIQSGGNLDPITLAEAVTEAGTAWGSTGSAQTLQNLRDEVQGLSVLEQFATLPGVSDVLVDGRGQVWTDSAQGLRLTGFSFSSAEQVRRLAVHFASLAGKRLDEAMPFVDVSVRGYRIHAVLPPVAVQGPVISIRVKQAAGRGLDQLLGAAHRWWQPLLQAVVSTEQNFLVTGGTGSGKTTLLQAMLGLVDSGQRLVIVEDTHELQVEHEHVVSLQARLPNAEHRGEVRLSDLVIQALRMRPDRLIVGECRGAEVRDFLAAMNTGHQGAAGTIHANDPGAVPARLAALGALAGWDPQATALQASSALDLLIHMARGPDGSRAPVKLSRLFLGETQQMRTQPLIDASLHDPLLPGTESWLKERFGAATVETILQALYRRPGSAT